MVVDRIERHDIINAVMLAGVILLLGFGILTAAESLATTVDEGLVEATSEPELGSEQLDDGDASDDAAAVDDGPDDGEDADGDASADDDLPVEARPAGEVAVRVANGARRIGVAAAGTEVLAAAGYPTLDPKNGPTSDASIVWYASGYAADGAKIADLLGLEANILEPMPADPGVPIDGAHVIVLLGVNSEY